jgi:hypothetical protein
MMHYLDHVFPLQYPTHGPDRRGWLLSLLLQAPPPYHASLALSAHHQQKTLSLGDRPGHKTALIRQEEHLETCISMLNHAVQGSCQNSGMGVATAVMQLVFYEVCSASLYVSLAHTLSQAFCRKAQCFRGSSVSNSRHVSSWLPERLPWLQHD